MSDVREKLCGGLRTLGVDARISEQGAPEEPSESFVLPRKSVGLIDIADGPIRWVNVIFQADIAWREYGGDESGYYTTHGVPDSRIEPYFSGLRILSTRMKSVSVVGRAAGVRWKF